MITFKQFILENEKRCTWCDTPGASDEDVFFGKDSGVNLCDDCRNMMYQRQDRRMMDMLVNVAKTQKQKESNLGTNTGY